MRDVASTNIREAVLAALAVLAVLAVLAAFGHLLEQQHWDCT